MTLSQIQAALIRQGMGRSMALHIGMYGLFYTDTFGRPWVVMGNNHHQLGSHRYAVTGVDIVAVSDNRIEESPDT